MTGTAQDQKVADSLSVIFLMDTAKGVGKMELLRNLSFNEVKDLKKAQGYAEALITLATREGNDTYLFRGHLQLGNKKRMMGDLDQALAAYFKSVDVAHRSRYHQGEANAYGSIADVYSVAGNHANAITYYRKAIELARTMPHTNQDSVYLASLFFNTGDEYLKRDLYDSSETFLKEAGELFDGANYPVGKAYVRGDFGMLYAKLGKNEMAEKNIQAAIPVLEENEDFSATCAFYLALADMYMSKGDHESAITNAQKSLKQAREHGLKDEIGQAAIKLSNMLEKTGRPAEALESFREYITYRDSVNNLASVQKMADLRTNFEVSQKQAEVNLLNQQKRAQLIGIISLATLLLALLYFYRVIAREKKRSESLLLNILPSETAHELKLTGKVEAIKFDQVTVLFTDFVGFSKLAEHAEPVHLVKSIDLYFKEFDHITTKHGLEKIKTIGDAYMCACGLPKANKTHARHVVEAAREMIDFVRKEMKTHDGLTHFDIRIGIHTGPVVAGIVGIKKWQYDIWGDTVNIASRMESMSEPGRINLSETTYQQIKADFPCEYRGEIEAKNRGLLKMYYLL
jgi:adenylate cyclase